MDQHHRGGHDLPVPGDPERGPHAQKRKEVRKKIDKADPSFEIVANLFSDDMYDYFCE